MQQLNYTPPNIYNLNRKKDFKPAKSITQVDIQSAFNFAYEMSFGRGHHRAHRTGGQVNRRKSEQFCNAFQGKLSEIALYTALRSKNIACSEVDFRIMGENEWDDSDILVNGRRINIKSAAFFSNLLLLEKQDWNTEGKYIPNLACGKDADYDFFVLVRVKPDLKKIFSNNRLLYAAELDKNRVLALISKEVWQYDIPGFISHQKLVEKVIKAGQVLPQNALLNGTTKMDAENYYVQAGDLSGIDNLFNLL
jgi:hypothetical protein